uniref:Nucleoside-diphosphate kinase n=1 Tax=Oncorhynchus tshawytscha TaxID=74940 RepID=A0A8C8JBG8_ONCTS
CKGLLRRGLLDIFSASVLVEQYIKMSDFDLEKNIPLTFHFLCPQAMEETRKLDEKKIHFLIDGFPRNKENLHGWTTIMDGEADVKFVLYFDCRNEKEGKSSGRTDDNRASLERRIQAYLQSTWPVISLYEKQGKVRTVDASYSVDKVFANVKTILDKEI